MAGAHGNKALNRGLAQAADRLELPADLVAGLPRMELTGFERFSVEGHTGIREYGQTRIVLGLRAGSVTVEGLNLSVKRMNGREIVLTGRITEIRLEGEA